MKKNILFILIGILALTASVFLFIAMFQNKPNARKDQPISKSAKSPSEKENSEKNIQNFKTKIKFVADLPSPPQAVENGYEAIKLEDDGNDKITLTDFKKNAGISIISQLNKRLDEKGFSMFYCPVNDSKKEYAIYFGYNIDNTYIIRYPDVATWMNDWEKTMLSDLHTVLFPNINFSKEALNQQIQFKDGKFRYAEVYLQEDGMGSINYHISINGILVSSSLPCMEKMVEIYEPLEP